jgi:hypothetical protein
MSAVALVIGAALIGGGSFLPWITVSSIISASRSGLDSGGDGIITLAIGVILALIAVANFGAAGLGMGSRLLAFVGGLAACGVAVLDGSDVANRVAAVSSIYVTGQVGMGLFVVGIGGGLAILVALMSSRPR